MLSTLARADIRNGQNRRCVRRFADTASTARETSAWPPRMLRSIETTLPARIVRQDCDTVERRL
jgi:hypothetical protein